MKDPTLRTKEWRDGKNRYKLIVHGGLHYIRGNSSPHFTLTGSQYLNARDDMGGAMHTEILRHFPDLADLAAMHLSSLDGKPMHAETNGWYTLAGYWDGAGERYHAGNSERHFPIAPPADKPWQNTEYRKPTRDECLQLWADHCRIDLDTARKATEKIAAKWNWPDMRAAHKQFIAEQAPRWQSEADACIAKHALAIFGDTWPPEESR